MIEIVYNKEKESSVGNEEYFCVPRNIRQIGSPSSECKIYVEDYVYEFLSRNWKEQDTKGKMAILLGKSNWKDGTFYLFVKCALWVERVEVNREYLSLKDEVWGEIYEEMKEYFPGQDVIGWYLSFPTGGLKVTDMIRKVHLSHFGGNDKVLFLADLEEQDYGFFVYRNGRMEKQEGFYVFYEKNDAMQEYILGKNPKLSVDYTGKPQDRAISDFRKIIARKNAEKNEKGLDKVISYFTTGAAVAAVFLGAVWIQKNFKSDMLNEKIKMEVSSEEAVESKEDILETTDVQSELLWETEISDGNAQTEDETSIAEGEDDSEWTKNHTTAEGEDDSEWTKNHTTTEGEDDPEWTKNHTASEEVMVPEAAMEHIVQPGDTLNSISIQYYGTIQNVKEICVKNNIMKEDTIYPGQKILLP